MCSLTDIANCLAVRRVVLGWYWVKTEVMKLGQACGTQSRGDKYIIVWVF